MIHLKHFLSKVFDKSISLKQACFKLMLLSNTLLLFAKNLKILNNNENKKVETFLENIISFILYHSYKTKKLSSIKRFSINPFPCQVAKKLK